MEAVHLSPAAHQRLRDELEDLTTRGRIEIAQKIEAARLLGDLSENGDYHAAKDEQGHMEGRIRELEHLLEHATIIEHADGDAIGPGSIVELRREGRDETQRYLIGSAEETTPEGVDLMSPNSPLGLALIGHRAGDVVSFEAPAGARSVTVVGVEPA